MIISFPGYQCFFPDSVHTWRELEDIASRLVPMMGIETPVYLEARARLGPIGAIVAVFYIHDRFNEIKNPGAYLRRLGYKGDQGGFNVRSLLSERWPRENCQLAIRKTMKKQCVSIK